MWEIVGASNLMGNTTLEHVRKRMAMQPLRIIRPETLATQATMGMKKEEVAD